MFNPKQMAAEVARARETFERVHARARACPRKHCRRRRVCLAGWGDDYRDNLLYHPTGGCPMATEAEWEVISTGIVRNRDLLAAELAARFAAQAEQSHARTQRKAAERSEARTQREAAERSDAKPPTLRRRYNFAQALWLGNRGGVLGWPKRFAPVDWAEGGRTGEMRADRGQADARGGPGGLPGRTRRV